MFKEIIIRIAKAFKENNIPYIIIGGQAVLLYGEPRLTKDIDIILGLSIDSLDKIIELVEKEELKPIPKDISNFVKETFVLPVIEPVSKIRIDLIFSFSTFERQAIKRARKVNFDEVKVNFVSLEDLIVFKIFSARARDIEDVRILLVKNKNIDRDYIKRTLKELSDTEKDLLKIYTRLFE